MLRKTESFVRTFNDNLQWIKPNRNSSIRIKGSYTRKQIGDIITDIDAESKVWYNENLRGVILRTIHRNKSGKSPFIFMELSVGTYDDYRLPWNIDNYGDCDYDPKKVREWFDNFKRQGLVPDYILKYVEKELFSEQITISNLVNVENSLKPYSNIYWENTDIERGYKDFRGKRYIFTVVIKRENPVMEFAYKYGANYVPVDLALVDEPYRSQSLSEMYRYYTNDWYKVVKGFGRKLDRKIKEHEQDMKSVTEIIALKYQLGLITKLKLDRRDIYKLIERVGVTTSGKTVDQISQELYELVNKKLSDVTEKYLPFINDKYNKKIKLYLSRGAFAQIPVNQQEMIRRREAGVKCPFFTSNMDTFNKITLLSEKLSMEFDQVNSCFEEVAEKSGKRVGDTFSSVVKNNDLSLEIVGDTVIFRRGNIILGNYGIEQVREIRREIILSE